MRYTATTFAADGRELRASGKTMPEAIRNADKLRKEYNATATKPSETKTQSFGGVNVTRS